MLIARYGGKRPLLRGAYCMLAYRLGAFRAYRNIDWSRVERLVIACSGNICRSPYAESRARQLGLPAISFGLRASAGAPADAAAMRNAAQRGTDLTPHRSRSVDSIVLRTTDLFVAMEPGQAQRLSQLARALGAQLTLQGLWASVPRPYVPDPYGHRDVCFQHSYALIDSSLECMKVMIRGPEASEDKRLSEHWRQDDAVVNDSSCMADPASMAGTDRLMRGKSLGAEVLSTRDHYS